MPSFHKRIRRSSVSLIALLLLIFCVSLYSTLSILLHRHVDAQLLSMVRPQADRVKKETGEIEESLYEQSRHEANDEDHLEHEEHELREAIRDSVVLGREGHVRWKGEGVEVVAGLDPILKNQVLQGRIMYETLQRPQGPPIRRVSFPITSQGTVQYILQTQTSLALVNETLQWLIITLGAVTVGILVCGWVGSNWMARMVLSPIKTLGQTATTVSAQSLDTRLFLDAPYEEFQQLAKSFNNMLERLQRVFESQHRFVGDAAHEFDSFPFPSRHEANDEDHLEHEEHELREAIRDSVVLGREGHVRWKGEGVEVVAGLDPILKNQVLQGRIMYETLQRPQGPPIRRVSFPITSQGTVQYILQTQTSLALVNETLQWLIITLGAVTVGILVCGWVGSNWMARMVLSPIKTLGQTATTVSAQSLDTRLFLDAPYEEFQQLAKSFNNMLERLQRVFESQHRFVGDAAHELKTPLTAMKGNLEVALQRDRSIEEYREVVSTSLGQVEHLARLVKSLLTLTKFSGEHPPIDLKPVLLEPLIQELVSELAVLAEEKGCLFTAHLQEVPNVLGDAGQLKQLVINLLDNAIRHTPPGESVTVTLQSSADNVLLTVEDTGSGIGTEHLPHIFERFYRADRARDRESGGTGLGLAIAKEIVLAHKGTITVRSEVGKGSVFTVSLTPL